MPSEFYEVRAEPEVSADLRELATEDERLIAKYKEVEAQIVKDTDKSLDVATDRLMASPDLARRFL